MPTDTATVRPPPKERRTLLWVVTSYFGEGLPWSVLHQMSTEFLTQMRVSKTEISSTSLLHLAVTFKFAWSPLVDLFGKKKTWVVALQVVLGLGMFVVAATTPSRNTRLFWLSLAVLAVIHATHDIACDGYYLAALDRTKQALFAGVRNAGYRAAMNTGKVLLVGLAGLTSWVWGFGAAGALMLLVALVNAAVMPSPAKGLRPPAARPEDRAAAAAARARAFKEAYLSFLLQPQAVLVLAFMFFYRLGDIMMFAMATPLLGDLGVSTGMRATISGVAAPVEVVGSILAGILIARRGLERCLVPIVYFQNLAIPLYVAIAFYKPGLGVLLPLVLAERFASGVGMAGHAVFLMQRSRSAFSASHFAFATAVVSLGSTLSGFASGPINDRFGHPLFFTIAFVASWPALVLVWLVPKTPVDVAPTPAP